MCLSLWNAHAEMGFLHKVLAQRPKEKNGILLTLSPIRRQIDRCKVQEISTWLGTIFLSSERSKVKKKSSKQEIRLEIFELAYDVWHREMYRHHATPHQLHRI